MKGKCLEKKKEKNWFKEEKLVQRFLLETLQ